jgi:anti-sigma-K factor RskA
MRDLAPTAGSTVYEAWVIASDGVPRPLGSFTVGGNGTAYFEAKGSPVEASLILAVTREPRTGAQTPTLPIVSSGTATTEG